MTNDEISLIAVGDIMLGDHPVRLGNGVRSTIETVGAGFVSLETKKYLKGSADIVFGNLEVVLSDIGLIKGNIEKEEFRGAPLSASVLAESGFNVLSLSNNHCMQHGLEAFHETSALLQKNGIFPSGIKDTYGRCKPFMTTKQGINMGLLSYSLRPEKYFKGKQIPYTLSTEKDIIEEVRHLKKEIDIIIVSLHWGQEFVNHPSPLQILFAHALVDAGVDVIIGHHPHVLQGIERYNNSAIVYSLGNFIFDHWQRHTRDTAIFKAKFSKQGLTHFEILPAHINDCFQPILRYGAGLKKALNEIEYLNRIIENDLKCITNTNIYYFEEKYCKLAKKKTLQHRWENYLFFIANIYKYRPNMVFKSLTRAFMRRLKR